MADPSVSAEPGKFQEVAKAAAELQKAVDGHAAYRDVEQQLEEARAMLKESQGEPGCRV
jgi:protein subunit release factor A